MNLLIVTGMSGAGKSQAVDALEDLGYYCVDNVPPTLLAKFAELSKQSKGGITQIALVVDVRSRDMFLEYRNGLSELKALDYAYKTLFLDCTDDVLLRRFKETRRMHPLLNGKVSSLEGALKEERLLLDFAHEAADYVVDTSEVSRTQLKSIIFQLFSAENSNQLAITCMSFGFKHGLPSDSDLVFDVRCLPNPFYIAELKDKTGLDEPVKAFVLENEQSIALSAKLFDLVDCLIPMYIQEGKNRLVIAFGCTGGKHRSVAYAENLARHLRAAGLNVSTYHRHIDLANET